jgi:hypothetical protein
MKNRIIYFINGHFLENRKVAVFASRPLSWYAAYLNKLYNPGHMIFFNSIIPNIHLLFS